VPQNAFIPPRKRPVKEIYQSYHLPRHYHLRLRCVGSKIFLEISAMILRHLPIRQRRFRGILRMFDPSVVNRMLMATRLETTFISRLSAATHGSATAIPAVRAAIQAYHASESGARDLIDTLFTILGQELDTTAAFIPSLANIVANDEKRADLLATWNKFKHEQEQQFPSLPSSLPTSQTGSRNKRAVQVKKLQANHTQRRVWDLVAQAASSSQPVQQTNSFSTPSSISSTKWSRYGAASMST
jgi:hypothetical protein